MKYAILSNKVVKVLGSVLHNNLVLIQYLSGDKTVCHKRFLTPASPKQILEAKLRGL